MNKTKILLVGCIGFFLGIVGSTYAWELNSGNIADPNYGNCAIGSLYCDMSNKGIDSIAVGTFSGYSILQSLDLYSNQLSSLASGVFVGLNNLQYLYLGRNQLSNIESGVFVGLNNLQTLNVSTNQLSNIESGVFVGLNNLQTLSLNSNQISSIESGYWEGLSSLKNLYLYSNQLSNIESGVFVGLNNLQNLNVSTNQLSNIESGVFVGLNNLQTLNVSTNQLSNIESGVFVGLNNLQYLDLGRNQLSNIESGVFVGLNNLQTLDLYNNCLNTEDPSLTAYLDQYGGDHSAQYVCVQVGYEPITTTSGSVVSSLYFTGPISYVTQLSGDNSTMSQYDYTYTTNGTHVYDYTNIVDANKYLWVNNIPIGYDINWNPIYQAKQITGEVTWIIPYVVPPVVSTPPSVGFAGGGGGGSTLTIPSLPSNPTTSGTTNTGVTTTGTTSGTIVPTTPITDKEQISAYERALGYGITTQSPITVARLENNLTRAELAKMFSVYATKVMKKTVDTAKVCNYIDSNQTSTELVNYMKEACQLNIMGLKGDGITPLEAFRPNDIVTRAQLVTTISRMLYGNKYDTNTATRWSGHMDILHTDGVVKVTEPTLIELRGYVMLMLYRLQ